MTVTELDDMIVNLIVQDDHPEIVGVRRCATSEQPDNHTRLVVEFADGDTAVIMVGTVTGPGIPSRPRYEIPQGAL